MSSDPIVLLHSPLVGPGSWRPVARELERRGLEVIVPVLDERGAADRPYWRRYAQAVAHQLAALARDRSVFLVAHSGAGPLLPAVNEAIARPVAAYVFADAGIPGPNGATRLEMMAGESSEWAAGLREHLAAGKRFPDWRDDDLRDSIPDPRARRLLIAELQPRDFSFFAEPIPVPDEWPDASCAYLHFSPSYDSHAAEARRRGWPVRTVEAGHFHMLVEPEVVASALSSLIQEARGAVF